MLSIIYDFYLLKELRLLLDESLNLDFDLDFMDYSKGLIDFFEEDLLGRVKFLWDWLERIPSESLSTNY